MQDEQIGVEIREALRNLDNRFNSLEGRINSRFNEVSFRITNLMVVSIIVWTTIILSVVGLFFGLFLKITG